MNEAANALVLELYNGSQLKGGRRLQSEPDLMGSSAPNLMEELRRSDFFNDLIIGNCREQPFH